MPSVFLFYHLFYSVSSGLLYASCFALCHLRYCVLSVLPLIRFLFFFPTVFPRTLLTPLQVKPRYVAMAFDVERETTFRRKMFPAYKAQRKPVPVDLTLQVGAGVGAGWVEAMGG